MQETFPQVRLWNAVCLTVGRETLKRIRKGWQPISTQRHPPAIQNLAHPFVTVPTWTLPYFMCKCDTIYYEQGGLRLFTVYLLPGGATVCLLSPLQEKRTPRVKDRTE